MLYSIQQKERGVTESQTRTGGERYRLLLNRFQGFLTRLGGWEKDDSSRAKASTAWVGRYEGMGSC